MESIAGQVRQRVVAATDSGEETLYSIAKKAGIGYPVLFRWIKEERDIRGSTLDALCRFFGLELREAGGKKKSV